MSLHRGQQPEATTVCPEQQASERHLGAEEVSAGLVDLRVSPFPELAEGQSPHWLTVPMFLLLRPCKAGYTAGESTGTELAGAKPETSVTSKASMWIKILILCF